MKITKGEHYIIRVLDENVKVLVDKLVKVGEEVVVTLKTESGLTLYKYGSEFKRAVENAAEVSLEELTEAEV